MIIPIANVLSPELLERARNTLAATAFEDGRRTAGWHARKVKANEQVRRGEVKAERLKREIADALKAHPVFQAAALPRRLSDLLLSRYRVGMTYGAHVDDALMAGDPPLRSDVSFTVFLSEPDSYEGGALVIDAMHGEQDFRLPAGAAIVYPSHTLHRVEPVTDGERLAAVGWAQSLVRDPAKREMLFDLETARRTLFEAQGKSQTFDLVSKTQANLLRRWAEV